MKHSHRTRLTALMFSAAAAGMLTTGCGWASLYGPPPVENVYGPPPVAELDNDDLIEITEMRTPETTAPAETSIPDAEYDFQTPIDLDSLTDADFRNMSDEMLTAMAKDPTSLALQQPAFCGDLPADMQGSMRIAKQAAADREEADALVRADFIPEPAPDALLSEKQGCYWLYCRGSGVISYFVVPDKAFFDPETLTLNADVTEENVLMLAAIRDVPGAKKVGAFVSDSGERLTCREYYFLYTARADGMQDTASLGSVTFSVDKATGQVNGFVNEAGDSYFCDSMQTVEVPDP